MRYWLIITFLFALNPVFAEESATVDINLQKQLGPVNRLILGHNIEAADSYGIFGNRHNHEPGRTGSGIYDPTTKTFDPQVVRMTKDIGAAMIRYPGGCLTHNFDWRKAVGKPETRPDFTFGVNEYLQFCRKVGAEPLMNVSTYAIGPREAVELVEYLNAPATPKYPWAMKRKEDGFPEPWHVKYFEIGNESDHGIHKLKPFRRHSPKQYVEFFNQCVKGMKAIDPTVQLGAHMATGKEPGDVWDYEVLAGVKDTADYIVIHTYYVGVTYRDKMSGTANTDRVTRGCMATADQAKARIDAYRKLIREVTGKALPLAITEFNAGFVQEKPIPYRFSFAAALFSTEYICTMLEPGRNILFANYWQYHHGYWGMLRKQAKDANGRVRYAKTPAFDMFRLLSANLGDTVLATKVASPTRKFEGYNRTCPCVPKDKMEKPCVFRVTKPSGHGRGVSWTATNDTYTADLKDCVKEQYLGFGELTIDQPGVYRFSFQARYSGPAKQGSRIGLGMTDSRGWDKTHSACAADGIESGPEWKDYTMRIAPLQGCTSMIVLLRLLIHGNDSLTGKLEVRNMTFTRDKAFPPYAVITGMSTLSKDGRKLYVILFNKDHEKDIATTIKCEGGTFSQGQYSQVSTENLAYTNLKGDNCEVKENVKLTDVSPEQIKLVLPARSMTALVLSRKVK